MSKTTDWVIRTQYQQEVLNKYEFAKPKSHGNTNKWFKKDE